VAEALRIALRNGYRLIDTATAYANEAEIGQVLQEFFKSGELKREDVFIVTKVSNWEILFINKNDKIIILNISYFYHFIPRINF
jgi:diketogulonate reductase-like aldo/keto reductase